MARPQNSPILAQLRSAKTYPEQAAALQVLKNEVVGHIQKKEAWIRLGVLEPIVLTLCSSPSPSKPNGKDARTQLAWRPLADEDSVRQQALQLIASFASGTLRTAGRPDPADEASTGGPAFLAPLHAARAVPALLGSNLSPLTNPPQIVVATLRALTDIADAAALATMSSCIDIQLLADSVFVPQHIESLNLMLSMTSPKHLVQSQVMLAAGLICRLCREERHQHALAAAGVLDSLATQLARFAVRDGLVVPGAEELAYSDGLYEVFPEPAATGARIGPILEAIAAILGDSKYRANRLANSPALLAIFPSVKFDSHKGPQCQPHAMTAMEFILPAMPINPSRSQSAIHSSLPTPDRAESRTSSRNSLSKFGSAAIWDTPRTVALGNNGDGGLMEDVESPLIPWLIHLVRTLDEYDRLMAVAVLAALFKAGLGRKSVRETSIGLLVVPILIGMLAKNDKDGPPEAEGPTLATQRLILEKAPAVLARLITDSEYLQKSAYDCDAVKILTKLLKRAYQSVPSFEQPKYWSPEPDTAAEAESTAASAQLGGRGQNPVLAHRIKLREASLKAIGALSAGKEDYRKALVAEDLVPYVVESLCEWPRKPRQAKERFKDRPGAEPARKGASPMYGTNPVGVIIAGCHVVRMLARSVSILRTFLFDYAVSLPVFHFMTHRDISVQIAATATVINLVVEVSPVREVRDGPPRQRRGKANLGAAVDRKGRDARPLRARPFRQPGAASQRVVGAQALRRCRRARAKEGQSASVGAGMAGAAHMRRQPQCGIPLFGIQGHGRRRPGRGHGHAAFRPALQVVVRQQRVHTRVGRLAVVEAAPGRGQAVGDPRDGAQPGPAGPQRRHCHPGARPRLHQEPDRTARVGGLIGDAQRDYGYD